MSKIIFIIDDDKDDVELFCEAIAEIGKPYVCNSAHSAQEAMDLLEKSPVKPDYIFLDLNLPGIKGEDFLVELKSNPTYNKIPVIIYTTLNDQQKLETLFIKGADAYITKPTGFEELKSRIVNAIKGIEQRYHKN